MPDSPHDRAALVKSFALQLGFDLVGITRPQPAARAQAYRDWIAAGRHGEMDYLARNLETRLTLPQKFPWAKSILCVALSYWQEPPSTSPAVPPAEPTVPPCGKIARYAWGRDYHKVIEHKLKRLEHLVRDAFPPASASEKLEIRAYCDTGPILERDLAAAAGLGWIGKNTLLIHPHHGSWFLLGELILSLDLEPDSPIPDHCGTCRRCLDACPTQALTPYNLDATKCISYLTLEHRGPVDEILQGSVQKAGYLIGCDICQDVCPFNRPGSPIPTREPDFLPKSPAPAVSLQSILAWQEQDWDILTRGRAFRRAKFPMWQRNARVLLPTSSQT